MGKVEYMKVKGSQNLRLRLLLSTLSSKPIIIEDIRSNATWPGLLPHEISFLHLLEKVTDDCTVQINETGTKLKYKPGILLGGKHLVHDCGKTRGIGYFLEPLIILGLFGKKPLTIRLQGITNDAKDPSFDTFRAATLPILKQFGVPSEGLGLKLEKRGVPPEGGGAITLFVPNQDSLKAVTWIDEGMVKRIRGYSFSTRVAVQFEHAMIQGARGIFNNFIPDVYVYVDHATGEKASMSPGYGISLIAETTSGCFISADTAIARPGKGDENEVDKEDNTELTPPEEVGEQLASQLLNEIEQGGVVDSTHQGFLFLLCALCPPDVSKVRVGKLSPYGIEVLRLIKEFLGVKFIITPDPATGTVILKCVGSGMKNLSRKIS